MMIMDAEEFRRALSDFNANLKRFCGSEAELSKAIREAHKTLEEQAKAAGIRATANESSSGILGGV